LSTTGALGEWDEKDSAGKPAPKLYFASVEIFVGKYLLDMYRRPVSSTGTTWCPEWWLHPEARLRLETMWRAWEHLRLEAATGMSVWLREHADYHMAVLLSSDGPFKGCTESSTPSGPCARCEATRRPKGCLSLVRPHD